ncbi:MAG: cation diffusion facilitator family transporter [Candidatus Dormibacteria bacterium]
MSAAAVKSTEAAPARHDEEEHRHAANRAVGVSAAGLAVTGGIELALAIFTGSVALLGDALHNLSDVSTSLVVFLGFRISKRKPSKRYPYGYERAEDLAGLGVALVIWASALFAGYESYIKFIHNSGTNHLVPGMAGAVIGVIGNQVVARYKSKVGKRIQSATLMADARHSWLDAISSVGALLGLVAVYFGYRWGDPVAGFAVTLFIAHVGYEVTSELAHHLMDGVDEEDIEQATEAAKSVEGVRAVSVRGRWMGRSLLLEVEGELSPTSSLEQAGETGRRVETRVLAAVPAARGVLWVPRAGPQ